MPSFSVTPGRVGLTDGFGTGEELERGSEGGWVVVADASWGVASVAESPGDDLGGVLGSSLLPVGVPVVPDLEVAHGEERFALVGVEVVGAALFAMDGLATEFPTETPSSLDHHPDGQLIAAGGEQGAMVFDARSGNPVATLFDDDDVEDVAFHPDGSTVATATRGRGIELWTQPFGEPTVLVGAVIAHAVAFSPDGSTIAASYLDSEGTECFVDLFDTATGEMFARLPVAFQGQDEHSRNIEAMAFSPGGDRLVTVSNDPVAVVWDTQTWEPLQRLESHNGPISHVDFDPVQNEAAPASADGTAKLWDLDTGTARLTLPGVGTFSNVSYSPDGKYLAAAKDSGVVQVFILDLDELVEEAESRLTRTWTEAECLQYLSGSDCPVS